MNGLDIINLRLELARSSQWNIGYFVAGFAVWLGILAAGAYLPLETARIVWIAATFFVLPIAAAVSRLIGADPFSNSNPLGRLIGHTHMSVITMSLPLVVATAIYLPELQLLAMAILYSIDFYVMSWAFGARLFALHAAIRTVAVTVVWFGFAEWRMIAIPTIVAAFYFLTIIAIPFLRARTIRRLQREPQS